MQFYSTLLLAAATLTSLVSAQSASDLPQCSLPCFIQYVPTTGCSLTDYACQCKPANKNKIQNQITQCVLKDCTQQSDQLKVLSVTNAICAKYGGGSSGGSSASMGGSSNSSAAAGGGSATPAMSASASSAAGFTPTGPAATTFTGAAGFGTAGGYQGYERTVMGFGGMAAAILMGFGF